MTNPPQSTIDLLRLTMIPGLGPVLISRAISALGSARAVLEATPERLRTVRGIGPERAAALVADRRSMEESARRELQQAAELGVRIIGLGEPGYPPLLACIADPPPLLYIRGTLDHSGSDKYTLAIVGSRQCTQYGREQAERFAGQLAAAGVTIASGGARGIDSAAHRAALLNKGRTVAVLGCGLAHNYPQENAELFAQVAANGAVVSELPLSTAPSAENFPGRNRIISGLSLGVLVIEAGKGSGSLITARLAAEDHGREVFAVPGRVDSTASEGTLELIKGGGAAMVTAPSDVLDQLETPARHLFHGSHAARYAGSLPASLFSNSDRAEADDRSPDEAPVPIRQANLSESQRAIIAALDESRTLEELGRLLQAEPARLHADVTVLELRRCIVRQGSRFSRA